MRLFGQMMMLPFTAFIQGMELFIKTIQGMQKATEEGMDVMAGGMTQVSGPAPDNQSDLTRTSSETGGVTKDDGATNQKEKTDMDDRDLSDDKKLKLVRYKILFIKRDYEAAFPEVEELVSDSMDDTAYTAWKVAEFIQRLGDTPVPNKWGAAKDWQHGHNPDAEPKYPPPGDPEFKDGRWVIRRLPENDKKYLRVYFEVLDRYDREKFKYEERQIEVLEEIRDQLTKI
ncbi:MAG TPA: hypothetical protein VLB46_22750 [Pyrinomonadaceae bacterium]|nr:hypothetical protein [Pyrinomonadaceae bacterium]